ncbi:hypothetical protein [Lentzea sp. NPDC004782]|uniref:hypothetical protein n=1 Tax=Lentzea sp. NPDC004782 TaxID=3154458 RepID=UPI0033A0B4DA
MSTKPHHRWIQRIGMASAVVTLLGGCSVEPIQTPAFSSSTTSTTPPPPPDKYSTSDWKSCSEVRQKLASDLPPPLPDDKQEGPKWSMRICPFRDDDSLVVFRIQYWDTTADITGVHTGAERAKKEFLDRGPARERDNSVNLGSDARWKRDDTNGCTLEILDENAVISAGSSNRKTPTPGNNEQCRGLVRKLAKQFFAAVQPQ